MQTYQITLIRRVIHLLEGDWDWVCMTYFCCLKNLSLSKKILALRTGFAPQRKTFVFCFCSVGFHFFSIGFHCSCLLSVCRGGFHSICSVGLQFCPIGFHSWLLLWVCPVGFPLLTFISALLAFIVSLRSQFALSAFICPVRILFRCLLLPSWLSLIKFALGLSALFLPAFWADNRLPF